MSMLHSNHTTQWEKCEKSSKLFFFFKIFGQNKTPKNDVLTLWEFHQNYYNTHRIASPFHLNAFNVQFSLWFFFFFHEHSAQKVKPIHFPQTSEFVTRLGYCMSAFAAIHSMVMIWLQINQWVYLYSSMTNKHSSTCVFGHIDRKKKRNFGTYWWE